MTDETPGLRAPAADPDPASGGDPDHGGAGWVAAVDLGATSGRVMLGRVGPGTLGLEAVHRFPNTPVRTADGLCWNILELYRNVLEGLRIAFAREPSIRSIGVDSWAVDYALLRGDRMISTPHHYRDEARAVGVDLVHQVVSPEALYAASGLQFLPFNTLYQLAVDQRDGVIDAHTRLLMIPDLIAFWLTGAQAVEATNASTTGLLDVTTGDWNQTLIDKLGLPSSLFPAIIAPGRPIGSLRPEVATEIGAPAEVAVIAVGSHDTASAVVGAPLADARAAYLSSGTWSLIGIERTAPVVTEASRQANFTNEGGVDGRTRFLHNVMGMWLLSESIRTWQREGHEVDLGQLLEAAAEQTEPVPTFDANDPALLPPGDVPARIATLCAAGGHPIDDNPAVVVRSIIESLALAYADAVDTIETLTGTAVTTINVVGGGSQNTLLGQLTADHTGRPVLAGPVEATALGNVLVQARAAGLLTGTLEDLRQLVARTHPPVRYEPS
jgi:rhamnulokinase